MICKQFKDAEFEIIIQQDDYTLQYSVSLIKNDRQVEFQGKLPDIDSALQVFDYYFDKIKGNDLTVWDGVEEI